MSKEETESGDDMVDPDDLGDVDLSTTPALPPPLIGSQAPDAYNPSAFAQYRDPSPMPSWSLPPNRPEIQSAPIMGADHSRISAIRVSRQGADGHYYDLGTMAPDIRVESIVQFYKQAGVYRLTALDDAGADIGTIKEKTIRIPEDHPMLRALLGSTTPMQAAAPAGTPAIPEEIIKILMDREDASRERIDAAQREADRAKEAAHAAALAQLQGALADIQNKNASVLDSSLTFRQREEEALRGRQATLDAQRDQLAAQAQKATVDGFSGVMANMQMMWQMSMEAQRQDREAERQRIEARDRERADAVALERERIRQDAVERREREDKEREERNARLDREENDRKNRQEREDNRNLEHQREMARLTAARADASGVGGINGLVAGLAALTPLIEKLTGGGRDRDEDEPAAADGALVTGIKVAGNVIQAAIAAATKQSEVVEYEDDEDEEPETITAHAAPQIPTGTAPTPPPPPQDTGLTAPDPSVRAAARAKAAGMDAGSAKKARTILAGYGEKIRPNNEAEWAAICNDVFEKHMMDVGQYIMAIGLKTAFLEAGVREDVTVRLLALLDSQVPPEVPRG